MRPRYAKIFVLCPAGAVTGGPEALHQLVHQLRAMGAPGFISLYPLGVDAALAQAYCDYSVESATPEDAPGNLIIAPEVDTALLRGFTRATTAVWWLSVDNFFHGASGPATLAARRLAILQTDAASAGRQLGMTELRARINFSQSAFAADFLAGCAITPLPLSDYLHRDFLAATPAGPRQDVIAYNPSKGLAVSTKLIGDNPDLHFVPIAGLSRPAVKATLSSVKLYIDFGSHPGRDRLPREAAISGACVITGRSGSAGNDVDVGIPPRFRICEHDRDFARAFRTAATTVLTEFETVSREFEGFRRSIAAEPDRFRDEIRRLFFVADDAVDRPGRPEAAR